MLKIVYLITLLTVGFSTLIIDGFRDISDRVPKQNIDIEALPYRGLVSNLPREDSERPVEACAKVCRESKFICNSFVVLKTRWHIQCGLFPLLGLVFEESLRQNSVIAVYERESLPKAHELSQRFSNSPSDQQVKDMSEKYGLSEMREEVTKKILKACSTALKGKFPAVISITDWLRTGDLARSQLRRQGEFREQLSRALELWQAWPRNPQAPLQYADTLVLTFLDIFFKSLDEQITTIYDPNEKTLIVEGPKKHLLIRSFGPVDYALIFAQGDSPLNTLMWSTYGSERSELDQETLGMFEEAMKKFGHEVLVEELAPFFPHYHYLSYTDSHTFSVEVFFDAILLLLNENRPLNVPDRFAIFFQDLVTAVVSSVMENEKTQPFQSNLLRATMRSIPDIRDINVIVG